MNPDGLTLLIPEKADPERDAVAAAWERRGGTVLRLGRFWDPPLLDPASVRVYGNDSFCLVLEQKLSLSLCSPSDDLLLSMPVAVVRRSLRRVALREIGETSFPTFIKSLVPKQVRSRVYRSAAELDAESAGLDPTMEFIVSDVVMFSGEARCFVLDGVVLDCAVYEGAVDLAAAREFATQLSTTLPLPRTFVVDVGVVSDHPAVIEFNAAWGAGLNGCDPDLVLPGIAAASAPP